MSDPMPANAVWQYDYIDQYRLDEKIIDKYLREKWGDYKYHVKVTCTFPIGSGASLIDLRQLVGDKYRFWVPKRLNKVCTFPSRSIGLAHRNQGGAGRIDQATKAEDVTVLTHNIASSLEFTRLGSLMWGYEVRCHRYCCSRAWRFLFVAEHEGCGLDRCVESKGADVHSL